jgi:hypothetical protein
MLIAELCFFFFHVRIRLLRLRSPAIATLYAHGCGL